MFKKRSLYSLLGHCSATIAGFLMAQIFVTFVISNAPVSDYAAPLTSVINIFVGALAAISAIVPILGWTAFLIKAPVMTLVSAIIYLSMILFATGDSNGSLAGPAFLFFAAAIFGFVGYRQERSIKRGW